MLEVKVFQELIDEHMHALNVQSDFPHLLCHELLIV